MNTKTNTADTLNADVNIDDAAAVAQQRDALREAADQMEARLQQLRGENDAAASAPTDALKQAKRNRRWATARKVGYWALGTGAVAFLGAYAYGRLRAAGVDLPESEIADAIVGA